MAVGLPPESGQFTRASSARKALPPAGNAPPLAWGGSRPRNRPSSRNRLASYRPRPANSRRTRDTRFRLQRASPQRENWDRTSGARRSSHGCREELQAWGVAPKVFQGVVGALIGVKNVHEHGDVIDDDPLADGKAIDRCRPRVEAFLEPFLDFTGDGFEVRLARARADDVVIGERRNPAQIENDQVFRLLFGGAKRAFAR
jgi:hypothetical protein